MKKINKINSIAEEALDQLIESKTRGKIFTLVFKKSVTLPSKKVVLKLAKKYIEVDNNLIDIPQMVSHSSDSNAIGEIPYGKEKVLRIYKVRSLVEYERSRLFLRRIKSYYSSVAGIVVLTKLFEKDLVELFKRDGVNVLKSNIRDYDFLRGFIPCLSYSENTFHLYESFGIGYPCYNYYILAITDI